MGNIVAFSVSESHRRSQERSRVIDGCGKVLFFTGVRYEKLLDAEIQSTEEPFIDPENTKKARVRTRINRRPF